ncbi:MAG TPA: xanthine dehydrogenase family protein subunit M [Gemmatimonadaceae bacterium]|jgi:xanthine dehydrogenase YagS FAD-binding subunit
MRPFAYLRASNATEAVRATMLPVIDLERDGVAGSRAPAQFLAGGTTLLDLMKLGTIDPTALVDINDLESNYSDVIASPDGLRLGALTRMARVGDHPIVQRDYPVIAQSLLLAASAQIRNMATLGGNVLQRTRCAYFRDPSYRACNKRHPGSGCAALEGVNRMHAVLGTSDECIATYPGDLAQALVALDASVDIVGQDGTRTIPFAMLHREPGDHPEVETTLAAGDLITGFTVPSGPWTRRSLYLKIRDRESYEFGVATAAVALDLDDNTQMVRAARIALGGVATRPWRSHEAEQALVGRAFTIATAEESANAAFASAVTHGDNGYKPELGRRTLVRALRQAAALEVQP